MRLASAALLALSTLAGIAPVPHAQVLGRSPVWSLPPDNPNTRFYPDKFGSSIVRPALSMRGFDHTRTGTAPQVHPYSGTTYGVRQVLERAFGVPASLFDEDTNDLFEDIVALANADDLCVAPNCDEAAIERNAEMLEARAFGWRRARTPPPAA